MPIEPNWDLLKEVDELLEKAKLIRQAIEELCMKDPAVECGNCGYNEWINGYCRDCGEHWRGKG